MIKLVGFTAKHNTNKEKQYKFPSLNICPLVYESLRGSKF